MKKIIFAAILFAAGALVFIFLISAPTSTLTPTPTLTPSPVSTLTPVPTQVLTPIPVSAPAPRVYNVEISNFAFAPAELKIMKGDSVVWKNLDSASHTVTSDSGREINSPLLSSGMTYSHTFNVAGTYDYHCVPHSFMKGRIIVE